MQGLQASHLTRKTNPLQKNTQYKMSQSQTFLMNQKEENKKC